ncbi:MAG: bifunctional ADP-dependent NAD(P)H-hydrate dehydratase/NAD(P)H-hydrate epimerase, partial [Acidovorax sp.]
MHPITPYQPHPLFNTAATRRMEQLATAALPPHTLMQRAGLAVARLAQALAPHART